MSWVRIDDGFNEHPKILRLSLAALGLHVSALCYANRRLTDGFIPANAVGTLRGTARLAGECVAAGVWEEADGGWIIHDYLDYQPSKADVAAKTDQRRTAGKAGGLAKAKHLASESLDVRYDNVPSKPLARTQPGPDPSATNVASSDAGDVSLTEGLSRSQSDIFLEMQSRIPSRFAWEPDTIAGFRQIAEDYEADAIRVSMRQCLADNVKCWPKEIRQRLSRPTGKPALRPVTTTHYSQTPEFRADQNARVAAAVAESKLRLVEPTG